jgi:hypothetical protein
MSSAFAVWMIMILLFMAIAIFLLRRHHAGPEPVAPLHENSGHSLNLPFSMPPATLTES